MKDSKQKIKGKIRKAILSKLFLASLPLFGILLLILVIVAISGLFFGVFSGLFGSQMEAQHIVYLDEFPIELITSYREAEDAYGSPWALLAGIHYVQTNFSTFLLFYPDDYNLPDDIWEEYKISRDDYFKRKELIEANGVLPEDYKPIPPRRDHFPDIVFTVANFLQDKENEELDKSLDQITLDKKKTEMAKMYYWLFQTMFKIGNAFWPIPDQYGLEVISSHFGDGEDRSKPHKGLDLAIPLGEPIYAFADGIVMSAGPARGYGNYIVIEHPGFIDKDGKKATIRTGYGHERTVLVRQGQKVLGGQKIAEVGSEGESTGPHLHFEVKVKETFLSPWKFVDPLPYLTPPDKNKEPGGNK
ncbi:M23 family metallopeptidase [Brevibacillus laterosporus]|uniref:M23 family metallopeptidase n=1 Tax=Brevibacillus laterosporus TaxID=1465 RepID=A0AAP3G9H7_BRELA|nr:M23 family metallopeptidase [Brevibacillus laterosporus]MCR8982427.1 M23 family metallopeptidase [Brevibacillus laterosporus]MCZ0809583.1 M23 family metallopeptidase [Brevibacillus laterosporus]MCZ0828116.1 M23 family metallopeptidase [Brevibacillus laterosporus]MCZ0852138.1 M23 family metallopeptidase [Brevibacillus laterosporus]